MISWTCPEHGTYLGGDTRTRAEQAVRDHFRQVSHSTIELNGFITGPVITHFDRREEVFDVSQQAPSEAASEVEEAGPEGTP